MSLAELFQNLNAQFFGGKIPLCELVWNSRLRSSAGRFSPGSRNPLLPRPAKIEIATYLRELPDAAHHIRDTLLHEMVHYYLWFQKRPYGHTPEFNAILKTVGASRYNQVPKTSPAKHHYQCPGCKVVYPTKRRIRDSACASCCKKYSRGRFDARFRLELCGKPQNPTVKLEETLMPVEETIRRLEGLKNMILGLRSRN